MSIVEYPALKGKIIRQVRFAEEDEHFTALILEFEDNTHVSFLLRAAITLAMEPEISRLEGGNIVSWRKLKPRAIKSGISPEVIVAKERNRNEKR
jgi:hypothetical protein